MVYLLIAGFAIVALAPLCSVGLQLIERTSEGLTTSQLEYASLLASTISTEVDAKVAGMKAQLDRSSNSLALNAFGPGREDDEIRRTLEEVADPQIRCLRFTDLHGHVVSSRRSEAISPVSEPVFHDAVAMAWQSLADRRPTGVGDVTASTPIFLPGERNRVSLLLGAPVVAGGRYLGVVSALVDLQSIWDEVVAQHKKEPHTFFAVDPDGRLFAARLLDEVELGHDMTGSEIVKRFREHRQGATVMPFDWAPGPTTAAERYLGGYGVSDEGWGIFVQARESKIYGPVSDMTWSIQKSGLWALGGALLAGLVFAQLLTNPIKRLVDATRAYAQGDFSVRVQVPAVTEAAELADRFNHMAADLESHIASLKRAAQENRELFIGTARALATAIDAKDPYTRGHSVRVNRYSLIIARELKLSDADIADINISSLLHDVGKIGVDDAVLKKPGKLTDEEFAQMKEHPVIGEKIMSPILKMKRALPGLRSHHERWDGTGYPDRRKGADIPLMARIIAVADTYDAMTTNRPYQKAFSPEAAHARLNELKGTGFDETIVEAFNRAYLAGEFGRNAPPATEELLPELATV